MFLAGNISMKRGDRFFKQTKFQIVFKQLKTTIIKTNILTNENYNDYTLNLSDKLKEYEIFAL